MGDRPLSETGLKLWNKLPQEGPSQTSPPLPHVQCELLQPAYSNSKENPQNLTKTLYHTAHTILRLEIWFILPPSPRPGLP